MAVVEMAAGAAGAPIQVDVMVALILLSLVVVMIIAQVDGNGGGGGPVDVHGVIALGNDVCGCGDPFSYECDQHVKCVRRSLILKAPWVITIVTTTAVFVVALRRLSSL